jgi:hypothetical protein
MRGFIVAALAAVFLGGCVFTQPQFAISEDAGDKFEAKQPVIKTIDNRVSKRIPKAGEWVDNKGLYVDLIYFIRQPKSNTLTVHVWDYYDDYGAGRGQSYFDPLQKIIFLIDEKEPLEIALSGRKRSYLSTSCDSGCKSAFTERGFGTIGIDDLKRLMNAKTLSLKVSGAKREAIYEWGDIQKDFIPHLQQFYDAIKDK